MEPLEVERLKKKIEAGAQFVITQPVIGKDPQVDAVFSFKIPVVIEAWMSKNIDLFLKSIRRPEKNLAGKFDPQLRGIQQFRKLFRRPGANLAKDFDPLSNLRMLHKAYPQSCIYLSMLGFKQSWKAALPRL